MKRQLVFVLAVAINLVFGIYKSAFADPTWTITQLTYNSIPAPETRAFPSISGTNVVWAGWDGSDYEIYSNFAGQLTNNNVRDVNPSISGTNVVWNSYNSDQNASEKEDNTVELNLPFPNLVYSLSTLFLIMIYVNNRRRS